MAATSTGPDRDVPERGAPDPGVPARTPRWRSVTAGVLVGLVVLLVPVTAVSVWARSQVLDTSAYLATVGPVIEDPAVQRAIASVVASSAIDAVPLDSLGDDLPAALRPLAAGLLSQLEPVVERQALRVVQSDAAAQAWLSANRLTHEQLVRVLRGDSRLVVDDALAIDLVGLSGGLVERLAARGIEIQPESLAGARIVLVDAETLTQVRGAVSLLDTVATVLPWVLVALLAALVALRGRASWRSVSLALLLGGVLLVSALAIGRGIYLDRVGGQVVTSTAAAALFEHLAGRLLDAGRAVVVVGIAVGLVGWLALGRDAQSVAVRATVGRAWTARVRWGRPVGAALVAVGTLALLLPGSPAPALAIACLVAVAAGVGLLVASGTSPSPGTGAT
ncbi:MAG: hypothetical protein HGA44_15540 [Cellulomonadaceae bacterium]|nr:hypothetical protein [Cellulomonadaceae bacterium]